MSILSRNACLVGGLASDLPDALYSDMKVGFVGGKAARKRPRQAASSDEESGNESDVPIVRLQTKRENLKKKLLELQKLSVKNEDDMFFGLEEAMKFV